MIRHRIFALLLLNLAVGATTAQELQNSDFNSLDGWNIEGGNASIENGKLHIYPGEETKIWQKTPIQQGNYVIKANVQSSSSEGICLVYGQGTGFTKASTAVPQTGNKEAKLLVKGIQCNDGFLEVGFLNDGAHDLIIDDIQVEQERKPFVFGQGGDITELNYVLSYGGNFFDETGEPLYQGNDPIETKAHNVIQFLKKKGWDMVRIRLTNKPGKSQPDNTNTYYLPEGFQDEKDCLLLAELAHEAGMKIQFTFNYSDYWSNGERQNIPADWESEIQWMNDNNAIVQKLTSLLGNYTKEIMQKLAEKGIYPEYVSLGNEINGGLLFPYGYSYNVTASNASKDMPEGNANWKAICGFINAGYDAVKSVSPQSKVVVHLADQTGDYRKHGNTVDYYTYSWFFSTLEKGGGKYDVIGASYYPSWCQSTVDDLVNYCDKLIQKFHKDILIMESGYNWNKTRKDGYEGQLNQNAEEYKTKYPSSPTGQKGYLTELINGLKNIGEGTNNQCVGVLYWDPVMIHVEDEKGNNKTGWAHFVKWNTADVNVVENTTLFDFEGKALPVLDVYYQNQTSYEETTTSIKPQATSSNDSHTTLIPVKGGLLIRTTKAETVGIYRLNGEGLFLHFSDKEERTIPLPSGIYIVNGEKVIVD
ncbi:MAG: glycosyl hydrolase 53 family protein [Paludibacteraceae bacterium]|nr:glycosyl hydrolase 53 family protein [Paludibacteraceae bacterium]